MSSRFLFTLSAIAVLTMACGLTSMIPGVEDVEAALTEIVPAVGTAASGESAAGLPEFEHDEDTVIQMVEDGQTSTLYDLINEADEGEMFEPGVQRYTVDIKSADLIDLSTGWCAKNTSIMEDNEAHITGTITVDGYEIPDDELVAFGSEVDAGESDDYPEGLACYSWDIIATQWPVGTHRVTEAWTLDSTLDDGYAEYQAGTYSIEYTVTVTE